jgi:hypothetical protein
MAHTKKAQMGTIMKAALFVLIVFIVINIILQLGKSAQRTADALTDKELNQFKRESGSLIHPDLPAEYQDFWFNYFINYLEASVKTEGKQFCHGFFTTNPGFAETSLYQWSIAFLQEGEGISIQLIDPRGVIAAVYPTPDSKSNSFSNKRLCIKKPDEKPFDVEQVTIVFDNKYYKSIYYSIGDLKRANPSTFFYKPYEVENGPEKEKGWWILEWLAADYDQSRLFFHLYGDLYGTSNRFCIMPTVEKEGKESGAYTWSYFEGLMNEAKSNNYAKFCAVPDKDVPRECVAPDLSKYASEEKCAELSKTCKNRFFPSIIFTNYGAPDEKTGDNRYYIFDGCSQCDLCSDANEEPECVDRLKEYCGFKCAWDKDECKSAEEQ